MIGIGVYHLFKTSRTSALDGDWNSMWISKCFPNLSLIDSVVPIHYICPSIIIAILLERASASSIEWVFKRMEQQGWSSLYFNIACHIFRFESGSIPVEGSSKSRIIGFPIKAMAIDSLRLVPPEYVPASLFL